ncbi:hypothetical protein pb186bvf_014369 [Paramecium bursaria]
MEIIEQFQRLLNSTPSVFSIIDDGALKYFGQEQVYDQQDEYYFNNSPLQMNEYLEDGEVPVENIRIEKKDVPKQISIEDIRNFKFTNFDEEKNLNRLAEKQAEFEVYMNNNKNIFENLSIYRDHLQYGQLYSYEASVIGRIKRTLILLSDFILSFFHKNNIRKIIYVRREDYEFRVKCMIIQRSKNKQITQELVAATEDMSFILAEGWIISQMLQRYIMSNLNEKVKLKDVHQRLHELERDLDQEYFTLLDMARQYFQFVFAAI